MIRTIITPVEKDSCGSCALACLTGLTWHDAKAAIVRGRWARKPEWDAKRKLANPTTGADLIDGAHFLGWKATTKTKGLPIGRATWQEVATLAGSLPAIVKVQYEDSRSSHWVVWDETGWIYDSNFGQRMDPDEYRYGPLSLIIFREEAPATDYPDDI